MAAGAVALLVGAQGLVPHAGAAANPGPSGDRVVLRFDDVDPSRRAAAAVEAGYELIEEVPGSDFALAVGIRPGARPDGDRVVGAAPVVPVEVAADQGDPLAQFQRHLPAIRAPQARAISDGTGAIVAVIDTGVAQPDATGRSKAPDLAGTAFVPGWDFVQNDAIPQDENGHGTHVISTIAATTGNGYGVAGVAPGATVMPLRVLDAAGQGEDWHVAAALRWAADKGANVANLSIGSAFASPVLLDAVAYARSKGVTVVAASGNDGKGVISWPAAAPSVIAVGAVQFDGKRASYSNFGPTLDLVAPGGDLNLDQDGDGRPDGILQESLDPKDTRRFCWCYLAGTSMAAPQVSAVAAMLVGLDIATPDEIERILVASAWDLGRLGRDDHYGHGILDARAAVLHATGKAPPAAGTIRSFTRACPSDQVPPGGFGDTGASSHAAAIDCVAWWGVASGASAGSFEPRGTVSRAQMASFLARLIDATQVRLPQTPPDAFTDDAGSTHEQRINQLAAVGVIRGRAGGTYAPNDRVTRAEMATFLARTHDLVAAEPLRPSADRFSDDDGSSHERSIDQVSAIGIAAGTSGTRFEANAQVRRDQMATFLARLLDLLVEGGEIPQR